MANIKLKANIKLNFKILTSCAMLSCSVANANFYIGVGGSFSQNSYSANSEDLGQAKNIQTLSELAQLNILNFDGTFVNLMEFVKYNLPKQNNFTGTFFAKWDTISNAFKGCMGTSYLESAYNNNNCPNGGTYGEITIQAFYEDIGSAMLYYLKSKKDKPLLDFLNNDTRDKISETIGREIIASIINEHNTTNNASIDANALTMDDINKWFKKSPEGTLASVDKVLLQNSGDVLGMIQINNAADILGIYQGKWEVFAEGIQNALIKEQAFINTNAILKSSASGNGYGALLSIGYTNNIDRLFYGLELLAEYEQNATGKNQNLELEISNKLALSVIGRLGYQIFNNSIAYFNLGVNAKDYKVSGFGIKSNSIIPHYLFGIGFEFSISENINLFTEFNHIVSITKLDTEIRGAKKLSLKSEKFNFGARFYLGDNPVRDITTYALLSKDIYPVKSVEEILKNKEEAKNNIIVYQEKQRYTEGLMKFELQRQKEAEKARKEELKKQAQLKKEQERLAKERAKAAEKARKAELKKQAQLKKEQERLAKERAKAAEKARKAELKKQAQLKKEQERLAKEARNKK